MKNEKDIRFYRTKDRIICAMITLLKSKSFAQITVKDICKEAEVSRSGFYLHYLDKFDLVEKYQLELIDHTNEQLKVFSEEGRPKAELMLYMMNFLKGDGLLLALLISDNGSPDIQRQVKNLFKENAIKNVLPHLSLQVKTELERKYFITFLSNALFGFLQEWVNDGQKDSPEELVLILNKFLNFDLV
ncbi:MULTISPECIES: TetR/AcrR family transcriptional regulator C-terminal domain-containing protein [Enterococcus]|uniref:TetR/AcrR family transcriptional regulator n=1 Tax=Enterococcus sp. AZ103 TaxID=2774628 RepID=UPI003F23D000